MTCKLMQRGQQVLFLSLLAVAAVPSLSAQLIDYRQAPNTVGEGLAKPLAKQAGTGRGDLYTAGSSMYIIRRDPFRSIRRGRQLFQRKFALAEGLGPRTNDGIGDIDTNVAIGAGLADSCAACHGRPRGAAGFGGDVATRPDSRDAPHLFGLGLKEMLADEITAELRGIRITALAEAKTAGAVTRPLISKGIDFGFITVRSDGYVNTSQVKGVDTDLRVRPFFSHGGTISIREFVVGAFNDEMGLQAVDPEMEAAARGGRYVTPSGMVLDGSQDTLARPKVASESHDMDLDGVVNEIPTSIVDHMEFYLLNYFKPGLYKQTALTDRGQALLAEVGCTSCHIQNLTIEHDRRVADVETVYDPENGIFNNLFATATLRTAVARSRDNYPPMQLPRGGSFVVENIFTDFKRHDLGPEFHERNYNGTMQKEFLTTPLWGVGSTAPYGHDGRSINLTEVILRHAGEAKSAKEAFAALPDDDQQAILAFLNTLIIFPPDDTASNLNPGDRGASYFPQLGHGSINLGALFLNSQDLE